MPPVPLVPLTTDFRIGSFLPADLPLLATPWFHLRMNP